MDVEIHIRHLSVSFRTVGKTTNVGTVESILDLPVR